jgi:hypothetical protein
MPPKKDKKCKVPVKKYKKKSGEKVEEHCRSPPRTRVKGYTRNGKKIKSYLRTPRKTT